MAKSFKSKFLLTKRYSKFSNICVYFVDNKKPIRYGYKLYQKIFKRYKSGGSLRINVRKPRVAVKRKTTFGRALEIKEKFSYLIGGIHSSKLQRYCRVSRSKFFAPVSSFVKTLETRLDIILYRSNIFNTPRLAQWAIKAGFVTVGSKNYTVTNPAFRASVNTCVNLFVPDYAYKLVYSKFKLALAKRLIFKPEVNYITCSYKLLRIIINDRPSPRNMFFPFNFNVNFFYRLYSV